MPNDTPQVYPVPVDQVTAGEEPSTIIVTSVVSLDDIHLNFKSHYETLDSKIKKYEELLKFNEALPGLYKKLDYLESMWEEVVNKEKEKKRNHDLF